MPLHRKNFSRPLRPIAIFGPGLIGGSVALASTKKNPATPLKIWGRSPSSLQTAQQKLAATASFFTDPSEAAADCSGAVLCTPVDSMAELAEKIRPSLPPDAWITDAGSVKGDLVHLLESSLGSRFIGAHPMAGSDKTGFAHARHSLFDHSVCILTPTPLSDPSALANVRSFWQMLGCSTTELSPEDHDLAVASISHLPHLAAAATVLAAGETFLSCAGPGYRDTTRVAAGSPTLWLGILENNRPALLAALHSFSLQIENFRSALSSNDSPALLALLQQAASIRTLFHHH